MSRTIIDEKRIPIANLVLNGFAFGTRIERRPNGLYVSWRTRDQSIARRWQLQRGSDFYTTWNHKWGHGGTASTAMAQLVRWIKHLPVLPMPTWNWWLGERMALARERGPEVLAVLKAAAWPESTPCVLCTRPLTSSLDWWRLDGVSGPCCSIRSGCHQRPESTGS